MKTAEEFIKEKNAFIGDDGWIYDLDLYDLIEFAKMHVTEALKQVIKGTDYDRQSILNAYPLDQIK